jgi:hypothetical protein
VDLPGITIRFKTLYFFLFLVEEPIFFAIHFLAILIGLFLTFINQKTSRFNKNANIFAISSKFAQSSQLGYHKIKIAAAVHPDLLEDRVRWQGITAINIFYAA